MWQGAVPIKYMQMHIFGRLLEQSSWQTMKLLLLWKPILIDQESKITEIQHGTGQQTYRWIDNI